MIMDASLTSEAVWYAARVIYSSDVPTSDAGAST
jgi:hypothetical protein